MTKHLIDLFSYLEENEISDFEYKREIRYILKKMVNAWGELSYSYGQLKINMKKKL
jgi:hypothetical protein